MGDLVASFDAPIRRTLGERRVAVALSGGVDSVSLLHATVRAGIDVAAVHVDHGLRPDSSDDAALCARLADDWSVPFETVTLRVERGNSTQGRARRQRYAALVRAAGRLGCDCVATAHHADDAVESAWLQAARGAGPIGRAGPERELRWWGFPVVRPLLDVSRKSIERYARHHRLEWNDDPTNTSRAYRRNRLRHDVLPEAVDAAEARASMPALRREAADWKDRLESLRGRVAARPRWRRLSREELRAVDPRLAGRLLLELAVELHGLLAGDLVEEIVRAVADDTTESRRFTGSRVVVEVSGDRVTLEAGRGQGTRLLDRRETVRVDVSGGERVPWFRGTVAVGPLDEPLVLRGPRPGDRVETDASSVLVRDLLARRDVPPSDRWWWPCLYRNDTCVRVLDHPELEGT